MNVIQNKSGNMIWKPNKTEAEWNMRIAERAGLSKQEFFKNIQLAVDRTYREWDDKVNTCITFLQSKFIMVVNKENNQIITTLDSSWGTSSRDCKRLIAEEGLISMDEFIDGVCRNHADLPWGTVNLSEDLSDIQIDLNCAKCISVRL